MHPKGKQSEANYKETKGDRTKKELYETALRLFREKGYENVSIREIVEKAGTAKGTFYIYFATKADVIVEMLRYYDDRYEKVIEQLPEGTSPLAAIQTLVWESCVFTEQIIGVDLIRVLYTHQLMKNGEKQEEMDSNRSLYRLLRHFFARGQEQGIFCQTLSPEGMTAWLIRAMRGTFYEWSLENGDFNLSRETRNFTDVLLQGFQK
ncbi:transcriptional regulator, TetR family [Acidaminococcus fermentans]|uniref:TetR/AcrR family transcriptional regulator n=1 Tax=Acidaminococcus fermentans TaxID=905 RepID=UPI0008DF5E57|nr:TetR/AcrR family transcriptional regulator [Acidaminococcus fermentans]SFO60227.1 transcriptional regulator, TetR family [Acidaminococcus fermentans]